jgi:hypothetical protein
MDGSDPLGFLAALGALRVVMASAASTTLQWKLEGRWIPILDGLEATDPATTIWEEVARWREAPPPAIAFARDAERKIQDLKHPPEEYRRWMHDALASGDREWAQFAASYATGVVVDGSGQTKPTSLHFTAGQQRFMDVVLCLLADLTQEDIGEALFGPWRGRNDAKNLRWRAGRDRSRALLSFDPSKQSDKAIPGANWLAFLALPLFPVAPFSNRVRTPCFSGRGKAESFTWPLWDVPLQADEVATLLAYDMGCMSAYERKRRGVCTVLRSSVVRSSQGYGNFAPSEPALAVSQPRV